MRSSVVSPLALCVLTLAIAACTSTADRDVATAAPESVETTPTATPGAPALEEIIAGTQRSEANRLRDRYRHPVETLQFFGITADQRVIEVTPGAGWYSEILAPWLNGKGQFVGAIWDDTGANVPKYFVTLNQQLREKFAASPSLYGNAKLITIDSKAPDFSAGAPADAILTFRNVHNWTQAGNDAAWFSAFFAALKPGGVLGVVDHRANAGTTLEATLRSGYLTEAYVIELATKAGFVLEARSEINANPADTKDHEAGVWTLPPTLGLKDKDREKYLAIGESDRMTLRFRKLGGDAIHSQND